MTILSIRSHAIKRCLVGIAGAGCISLAYGADIPRAAAGATVGVEAAGSIGRDAAANVGGTLRDKTSAGGQIEKSPNRSAEGILNNNAQTGADATRGLDRAEERMSDQGRTNARSLNADTATTTDAKVKADARSGSLDAKADVKADVKADAGTRTKSGKSKKNKRAAPAQTNAGEDKSSSAK